MSEKSAPRASGFTFHLLVPRRLTRTKKARWYVVPMLPASPLHVLHGPPPGTARFARKKFAKATCTPRAAPPGRRPSNLRLDHARAPRLCSCDVEMWSEQRRRGGGCVVFCHCFSMLSPTCMPAACDFADAAAAATAAMACVHNGNRRCCRERKKLLCPAAFGKSSLPSPLTFFFLPRAHLLTHPVFPPDQ